jgi:hypothetical protein
MGNQATTQRHLAKARSRMTVRKGGLVLIAIVVIVFGIWLVAHPRNETHMPQVKPGATIDPRFPTTTAPATHP